MTSTLPYLSRAPADVRYALRAWILERRPDVTPDAIDDRTPLIEAGYVDSLDVAELLLFVEHLRGVPVDIEALTPGAFRDIGTIEATFFGEPVR